MLKVYEWLVHIIMRPCKSFQHLIKWFGIFIRAKTNYRKRKERLNREKKEKLTSRQGRGPPLQPAQPTRGTPLSSSTPRCQAARWRGVDAVDATSTPRTF